LIRQDNVVGFEDEEEKIINYLKETTDELDVISIIGMPGLGKTTLAWKIYQSQKIQFEFPTRIWVNVSQAFNRKDVFLNIMKEFTSQDMSGLNDQDLALTVRACLEKGKFLLVLDDVSSVDAWNAIRHVLPKSNWMGKVLITSRYQNVGTHANVTRKPHMLRFLTEKESWELLQLEVFGKLGNYPQELKGIGEYIANQCDGLPLAIVVIGGILVDQFSATEAMTAIINAWSKNDKEQRISNIVELSYNRLRDELRECFLYLGVFPEDYEIPAWSLTRLWIAEGFIQHVQGQSLEETAYENLKDLINRNLVMVEKTYPNGEVKTCRVHDVIHAFCSSKSGFTEQNLFQEMKISNEGDFDPPLSEILKYRRISIHSHLSEFLSRFLSGKQKGSRGVRSFLCFYKEPVVLNPKYISTIPDSFTLLRVLDSNSIKFTQFPIKVTKLIHLRYITLSYDDLEIIPEAVSELWNLQTLVVDTKSRSLTVKANIWKLIQLRHLKTKAAIVLAVQEGEAGENLQTFTTLSPECCTKEVFNRARNLKRLGIRGKLATHLDTKALEKLDRLENLKLVNDLYYESTSENRMHSLLELNCFPPNLKSLTLSATSLDWKHMSTLENINSLQVLKLEDNAFTGKSWNAVGEGFSCLQFLRIANSDLVFWEATADHFPYLRCLVLKNCRKLMKIPLVLARSLQTLDIERLSKSGVESAREIQEEAKRMQEQQKARWGGFKLVIGPGCE
ncbi:putative late blight resistance protein homolog r1a-6, partial [Phtheirospermum japonicum]